MKKKICLDNTSKDKYFYTTIIIFLFGLGIQTNTLKRILELTQEEYEQKIKKSYNRL